MSVKLKKILFFCAFALGCAKGLKEHYDLEKQKKNIENLKSNLLDFEFECVSPMSVFACDSAILRLYLYYKFDNKIEFCDEWQRVFYSFPPTQECSDEKINEVIALFGGQEK